MLRTVIFWLGFTLSLSPYLLVEDQTWEAFNTKFGPQCKDRESSSWIIQNLELFCILVALILVWSCVKKLRVTKIVKQIKFEDVLKVQFLFFSSFLLILTKFSFWEEGWTLRCNSMKYQNFPDILEFLEILSFKSFGNSWGISYIPSLLLIITLLFTCGEKKICSSIKMSQNIMNINSRRNKLRNTRPF